jgi:AcrR family transcriptional regulator
MAPKRPITNAKQKILSGAAKLFLTVGYERASIVRIAEVSGVNRGSVCFFFKDKESLVTELVTHVLEFQFEETAKLLKGKTEDKILFYAAETVLQLHLAESSEHMREMYNVAYSMPNSANAIFHTITTKQSELFREYLPNWEAKDFYEREIASAGIMRNHISVPCDYYYTMDRKIRTFLETTFLIFRIPDEKIKEAIDFVSGFDWPTIASKVFAGMPEYLEKKIF